MFLLTGRCRNCTTLYSADHECSAEIEEENHFTNLYLNSAKYVKVGQSICVDRVFSNAVVNAMYSFHASASAYMEFWNNSLGKTEQEVLYKMSCCQIWQAFVQESIHTIAASADMEMSLRHNLAIDEITEEAFSILGKNGAIRAADQHSCSECTHEYIETILIIL
jgi:CxC5 like cysteine cluster associated with KDZ transposases